MALRIDVWSDLVCPFCWIGKRRLDDALARTGTKAQVVLHAFELDPGHGDSGPLLEHLARKFGSVERAHAMTRHVTSAGATDGLVFDWARAVAANTFDAHRLVLHAQASGDGGLLMERLMRAHFEEGADLADAPTLVALATQAGLDPEEARRVLASDAFTLEVREDEAGARDGGVTGVPFFVFDGRFALAGAQGVETFERALAAAAAPRP